MLYLLRLRPKLNDEFHRLRKLELSMPFVIEKTKDLLYQDGFYEGEKMGEKKRKLEDAIIMIKDFEIEPEKVAKKLDIPLELLMKILEWLRI